MNLPLVLHLVGAVLVFTALFMVLPLGVSLLYGDGDFPSLAAATVAMLLAGGTLFWASRAKRTEELKPREGMLIVTLSWVAVSLFGSLPYFLEGTLPSFTNAYFEAMAGFTTTGASVLQDVESVPRGILFWRSMSQWLGGMGIILFALAVLPFLGAGGAQLFKAEVPELTVDKLRPRIVDTAKALWYIYVLLTALAAGLYWLGGMGLYDAVCHAFTTLATGGFSTKNASMAHFQSPFIHYVAVVFMFMAGINYSLYFYLFRGRPSKLLQSDEFRFYLLVGVLSIALVSLYNMTFYGSLEEALRASAFQVVSLMTTTGYATADYELWAPFSQALLVVLMFYGGMIGSTGGGMKQVRMLLMLKQGYRELYQLVHPHAVVSLKLDRKSLGSALLGSIWGFLFLFLFVLTLAILLLSATGLDLVTAVSAAVSAMCNVGPALGDVGPTDNYASIPGAAKWVLIFCMLAGRLELYTVLVLFIPAFWKQ
jgi:trk system potassium uptake protein TrkH